MFFSKLEKFYFLNVTHTKVFPHFKLITFLNKSNKNLTKKFLSRATTQYKKSLLHYHHVKNSNLKKKRTVLKKAKKNLKRSLLNLSQRRKVALSFLYRKKQVLNKKKTILKSPLKENNCVVSLIKIFLRKEYRLLFKAFYKRNFFKFKPYDLLYEYESYQKKTEALFFSLKDSIHCLNNSSKRKIITKKELFLLPFHNYEKGINRIVNLLFQVLNKFYSDLKLNKGCSKTFYVKILKKIYKKLNVEREKFIFELTKKIKKVQKDKKPRSLSLLK
jgi:hypothetical protein